MIAAIGAFCGELVSDVKPLGLDYALTAMFLALLVPQCVSRLHVLVALAVSCAAFLSLGFLVAALSKTAKTAQAIGMFLSFGMMFISGAGMPLELMPESLRRVSDFMPLTYVVVLMRGVWKGDPLSAHPLPLLVLVGMAALCAALSSRVFRWE